MICRIWRGWTTPQNANAYESYLRDDLFPRLARELAHNGYRGFHILRLPRGDEVQFVTLVWFGSGQAGTDAEIAAQLVAKCTRNRILQNERNRSRPHCRQLCAIASAFLRASDRATGRQPPSFHRTGRNIPSP